jgi:hypothetical protein
MVEWRSKKPERTLHPADLAAACRTAPARRFATIYADWMAASPDGRIPEKATMDLVRLAPVMTDLMLFAVSKPDRCLCRLAGEAVKREVAAGIVGRNYYEIVPEERRAHARSAMHMVVDRPSGYRAEVVQRLSNDYERTLESLALPLRSTEPGVDGFILITVAPIGESDASLPDAVKPVGVSITRRDLIDLGFGVEEDFVDYMPE